MNNPPYCTSSLSSLTFTPSLEARTTLTNESFTISFFDPGTANQRGTFTQTPVSGSLVLPSTMSLAAGTYDILVSSPNYLRLKMAGVTLASNQTIVLVRLPAGDLNGDNQINTLDWSIMNQVWFTSSQPSDINRDTLVNSVDYSWMNKNWGRVGE